MRVWASTDTTFLRTTFRAIFFQSSFFPEQFFSRSVSRNSSLASARLSLNRHYLFTYYFQTSFFFSFRSVFLGWSTIVPVDLLISDLLSTNTADCDDPLGWMEAVWWRLGPCFIAGAMTVIIVRKAAWHRLVMEWRVCDTHRDVFYDVTLSCERCGQSWWGPGLISRWITK